MKKTASFTLAAAFAFALAACGSSDEASETAEADNVEMPAEEAVNAVDEAATPATEATAADPAATATATATATPAEGTM